jgi:hypothetical protein
MVGGIVDSPRANVNGREAHPKIDWARPLAFEHNGPQYAQMNCIQAVAMYSAEPSLWPGRLVALAAVAILIGVPILVIRARRRTIRNSPDSKAIFSGIHEIRAQGTPEPGEVRLIFHTYSGFLVYTIQRKHDLILPADQAKILLGRMFKHNLTRGLFVFLPFFVVPLSLLEYRSQSRKMAAANKRGFPMD